MTTPDLRRRPDRTHRTRAAGAFGAAVLAAATIATVGTGTAAAATAAEILTAACTHYEPDPVWNPGNPALNRVSDCHGAYLFGADLAGANLAGANLNSANLFVASLNGANLTGANLTGAILTYANLTFANLNDANLNSANLNDTDLTSANLTGSSVIPGNVSAPATSVDGATATWTAPTLPIGVTVNSCDHTSGTQFPIAPTLVTCTVGNDRAGTGTGTFTVTTQAPLFADTTPVALTGTVGTVLTRTFTATGTPNPTVTVVDPTQLPPGMTFRNATGVPTLSGTPTAAGSYTFTLTADNGVGTPKTLDVTMTVAPTPVAPVFADTTPVALTGTVGTVLTRTFTATGTPNPTVTVVDPTQLPPGMTFANDPVTGVPTLSGTPTAAGSYTFTLTADNGVGAPVSLTTTVTVEAPATGSLGSLFGS
ncbi:pentapeptide repeat-containing protein [Rhodococcus sp. OK302]|uniref:pentapeptide repeat-containing protein n=1 Tax=Rhodococcus sp. OK302 TaxID=1882769 RepID=UPI000B9F55B2|nr:pentapeptide repeat-containing protein [Rhodococcus sp. OK302]OYD61264.1 putative Ig domain-containing protein [Rhodococcus sp. OK302]